MFWKRKRPEPPDTELAVTQDDKREHFRVRLPPQMHATLFVGSEPYAVRDLSAGGAALVGPRLTVGGLHHGRLEVARSAQAIEFELVVVDVDFEGVCHARFQHMDAESRAEIHRFVLEVQKHEIRSTRERRLVTDDDL